MLRAISAILVWALICTMPGIPVLLAGLIYPSRRLYAWASNLWARALVTVSGATLDVEGLEHVEPREPRFYMANHQAALDIAIMIVLLRGDVRFFSKDTLFRIPVFGGLLRRYGCIPISRSSARATLERLDQAMERLRRDPVSIAVFPEGTRSRDGRMLPFRKGTMKICQRAGLPVVPVAIDGSYRVNPRDEFRVYPGRVRVAFGRPIPAEEVAALTPQALHDRVRDAIASLLRTDPSTLVNEEAQVEPRRDHPAAAHP